MAIEKSLLNLHVYFILKRLLKNFPYERDRIQLIQFKKLKALLQFSYANHHFYRTRMDKAGMPPEKFRSLDDIQKLPMLSKEQYGHWIAESFGESPKRYQRWYRDGTSGSTGKPLTIYRPWREQAYIIAKWLRELIINGYQPLRHKTFCLISPHRVSNRDSILQSLGLFRRDMLSYLSTPQQMVDAYNYARPDFFYANKSQFVQMATYAKEHGVRLHKPLLYACGAETMDDVSRRLIYSTFGEDGFFETYGCVELGILGFQERKDKSFLHFCHDTNILELCDNGDCGPEAGHCVITDLHQRAFPLIRYKLGDFVYTDERDGLKILRKIRGREDDWIFFEDGTRMPFHVFYEIMEKRCEVLQFKVIQETYDFVRMLCVVNNASNRDAIRDTIIADLKRKVRADIHYRIEFVDVIPPDNNGKLRMLISNVNSG